MAGRPCLEDRMITNVRIAALFLILSLPLTAEANGFRRSSQSVTYYAYYPAPVVFVPVQVVAVAPVAPLCVPAAVAPMPAGVAPMPGRIYATPTPAPPLGSTTTPPATTPPPAVKESRNYFDAYAVAGREGQPIDGQRCRVGFWNNTGRDLVLRIDGKSWTMTTNQGMTLDLRREFVWQVDNREPRQEKVAADQSGMEIVIRR
jgi:hypothetical protein